jgi:hypothetical protein
MIQIPQELDWVGSRAACTVSTVFNEICDGIRYDVEIFNRVAGLTGFDIFQAIPDSSGKTMVVGQPNQTPRKRVFIGIKGPKHLSVQQEWDGKGWDASIGLNDEGRCILRLSDGRELERWQFRKKALEGILFGD